MKLNFLLPKLLPLPLPPALLGLEAWPCPHVAGWLLARAKGQGEIVLDRRASIKRWAKCQARFHKDVPAASVTHAKEACLCPTEPANASQRVCTAHLLHYSQIMQRKTPTCPTKLATTGSFVDAPRVSRGVRGLPAASAQRRAQMPSRHKASRQLSNLPPSKDLYLATACELVHAATMSTTIRATKLQRAIRPSCHSLKLTGGHWRCSGSGPCLDVQRGLTTCLTSHSAGSPCHGTCCT